MDGQDEGSRRIHNQRDLTNRDEGNSEDTRKLYWWSIRRGEEELILRRGPRTDFDPPPNYAVDDPVPQRSCPTIDEVLAKAQFLSPLLYQIHCIGPVGFGFAHIYSERHPQTGTLHKLMDSNSYSISMSFIPSNKDYYF